MDPAVNGELDQPSPRSYPDPPERRQAGELDESGRGLAIADMVADAWWVEGREYDKTVHTVVLVEPVAEGVR